MTGKEVLHLALGFVAVLTVAGCAGGKLTLPTFLQNSNTARAQAQAPASTTKLVERDVEAPDVFQVTEPGLWDGRPSLGGVWVAYPGITAPERVIIRNQSNGKFVIGALFRRESMSPGPKLQVSSEAAAALAILAGQPTVLNVTVLRRAPVATKPTAAKLPKIRPVPAKRPKASLPRAASSTPAPAPVAAVRLAPVTAAGAIGRSRAKTKPGAVARTPAPPRPTLRANARRRPAVKKPPHAAKPASGLAKPFVQVGIFSVETNAGDAGATLRLNGIVPTIRTQTTKGRKFWRVLVGPVTTAADLAIIIRKIKALGFKDAYLVSN